MHRRAWLAIFTTLFAAHLAADSFTVAGIEHHQGYAPESLTFLQRDLGTQAAGGSVGWGAPTAFFGTLLGAGDFTCVELATANTDTGRNVLRARWPEGIVLLNRPDAFDLVLYEQGLAGQPEAFGLAVVEPGEETSGAPRFVAANAFDATKNQFATLIELRDFGIAENSGIVALDFISLHSELATGAGGNLQDVVTDPTGQGPLLLDFGEPDNATTFAILPGPMSANPTAPFPTGQYRPDLKYAAALTSNPLVVETTLTAPIGPTNSLAPFILASFARPMSDLLIENLIVKSPSPVTATIERVSPTEFLITFDATMDETLISVEFPEGAVVDATNPDFGNQHSSTILSIDRRRPELIITLVRVEPEPESLRCTFEIAISESCEAFDVQSIEVGGTSDPVLDSFHTAPDGSSAIVTLQLAATGSLSIALGEGFCKDQAGNVNIASQAAFSIMHPGSHGLLAR